MKRVITPTPPGAAPPPPLPFLTRAEILAKKDIVTDIVDVPEWGGRLRVRGLTGTERDLYEESITATTKEVVKGRVKERRSMVAKGVRAKLCALCIVDEGGTRIFTDEDIDILGDKSAVALQRVFDAAARLSGMTEQEIEAMGNASAETAGSDSRSA
jgi:hypothetical protein